MKKELLSGAWGGLTRGRQTGTQQSLHVAGPLEWNRTVGAGTGEPAGAGEAAGAGEPAGAGEAVPCSGLGVV